MGSISGFKEYVDKDHPACPLCGGATTTKTIQMLNADKTKGRYKSGKPAPIGGLLHSYSLQECVNCGAQNKDGEILRDQNPDPHAEHI